MKTVHTVVHWQGSYKKNLHLASQSHSSRGFIFIFQVSYQSLQIFFNSKLFKFWQSDARMFPQLGIRKIVFQVSTLSKENYKITFPNITNAALTMKY